MSQFKTTPAEINTSIRKAYLSLTDCLIPQLESEAISILIQANICDEGYYNPPYSEESDAWRVFWLNEAHHQCEEFDRVGDAGQHLEQAERAAVNVLVSASALRDALSQGRAEEAAALAMILVSDAVMGGLSIEFEEVLKNNKTSKRIPYESGIGKKQPDIDRMREEVLNFARNRWEADPSVLIGKVASEAMDYVSIKFSEYKTLVNLPKDETALGWLRNASKSGDLKIPSEARKAGRPPKCAR